MAGSWESSSVKALLRLTSQRLGQLQEKKDSQGTITRGDIATLLRQGNIGLARVKAQNLIQDDVMSDLLEVLEMHVGVLIEHLTELEQTNVQPSPVLIEAASSIIYAAPRTESKDLNSVRDLLIQRLGPDLARSASANRDNYVSPTVIRALSAPPPSAANLNQYLANIAQTYGVQWSPEPERQDIVNTLSEILDPESGPIIDLPRLRQLCLHGLPDEPAWLRPRIWKLFLGITPVLKSSWANELAKHRESYYDLIRRLLPPYAFLPPPSSPLSGLDKSLSDVYKHLSRIPPSLFSGLEEAPEGSSDCPLHPAAHSEVRIDCAENLDTRLKAILSRENGTNVSPLTPEIRLEADEGLATPEVSLTAPDPIESLSSSTPTTLLASKAYTAGNAHSLHLSALLRLLYLHTCINPGNYSPHIPSLLVPLYSILNQEIEAQELAHVEADTFWLFEAMVGEFSELEDEEGGNRWMKRLSERLAWADPDLSENLAIKGLDPALPHYSYRWMAPLLTQTLPLSAVYLVWDALLACPMTERDKNPKLEYLVDICTGMLLRAKPALLRLGKANTRSPGLWVDESNDLPPVSPVRTWELGDAFVEGVSLLQHYPVEAAGGIDRLLQTAADLAHRREVELKAQKTNNLSLGARLKVSMWKGFTNQLPSPERSPVDLAEQNNTNGPSPDESPDEGNETETQPNSSGSGLTTRFANTVWKGITNQTSMEAPPSPVPPPSPIQSAPSPQLPQSPLPSAGSASSQGSSLWSYAEKLKESDAAATLSKVSSNWRAKALLGSWGNRSTSLSPEEAEGFAGSGAIKSRSESLSATEHPRFEDGRRGSLPLSNNRDSYSPPPRPAFFRPPRDSILPPPRDSALISPEVPSDGESSLISGAKSLQATFATLTGSRSAATAPAKSAPRPLLLGSSTMITSPPRSPSPLPAFSQATKSAPVGDRGQWTHVTPARSSHLHRESLSSVSSLSPSDALRHTRQLSDWDSDAGTVSRRVPLNRRSISPMAPPARVLASPKLPSESSSANSSDHGMWSPRSEGFNGGTKSEGSSGGWSRVDLPSPPMASPSPPAPRTPLNAASITDIVQVKDTEPQRGSVVINDAHIDAAVAATPQKKTSLKRVPPTLQPAGDTSDSSAAVAPHRSPRIRSKRHPTRPANLRIQDGHRTRVVAEQKSPSSLGVEWPEAADVATTPRATHFEGDSQSSASPVSDRTLQRRKGSGESSEARMRKASGDGHEPRIRKVSTESRTRKTSSDNKDAARRSTSSAADEADVSEFADEGYDDLLSAYESEDGSKSFLK